MSRPKCPNHGCQLQATDERRIFICPVSDYPFECDVSDQEGKIKIDKFGNKITEWVVTGDEN